MSPNTSPPQEELVQENYYYSWTENISNRIITDMTSYSGCGLEALNQTTKYLEPQETDPRAHSKTLLLKMMSLNQMLRIC